MRRRDEPKLDELKKLLRRLENLEVDSGLGGTAKPASNSAPPGYVGALRGAGPAASFDERQDARRNAEIAMVAAADGDGRPRLRLRSFGVAAIIIGATTAAVVSSLIAVALSLWVAGPGRDPGAGTQALGTRPHVPASSVPAAGERPETGPPLDAAPAPTYAPTLAPRQTRPEGSGTLAPPAPAEPARPPPQSAAGVTTVEDAEALVTRADRLIRAGNMAEARLVLERASGLGSGAAALALGATYDPARIAEFGNAGAKADIGLARAWYERARALGTVEAASRLTELAKR
jgi:hypothetical protein